MLVSPLLARWSLSFGPPETFALMLVGLTTVTLLTGESAIKGYISMLLGLMLAMVGFDIVSGEPRFAFGIPEMMDGIDFLPVGDRPVRARRGTGRRRGGQGPSIPHGRYGLRDVMPSARDWVRSRWAIARGTVLGFFIGVLPGAGPTVSTFLSYAVEKKVSKHPEEFGKGAIEGVAGPESANNAAATGAMVPMLTLGIPGSATTAIMLGGLMMWGLRPGPLLFEKNPQFVWGLIASQYIANAMLLVLSTAFIPLFVRALRVPYAILMPIIVIFCVTGAVLAQEQCLRRRPDAGVRRPRLCHEEARLLAGGAGARAGAGAARRAGAAPVADHLRQRHRHLLHAADRRHADRRRAAGGAGAGGARDRRGSRAQAGGARRVRKAQVPVNRGFLFSMNAA
jgi:TctA family transporter